MDDWSKDEKSCVAQFYAKRKANKEQFHSSYDNSRRFLRYFSYGCYSIDTLLDLIPCSKESYFAFQKLYQDILPSERYVSEKVEKKNRPAFRGDAYYGNENFLAETFRVKSLRERVIFFFIHLLPCLADAAHKGGFSVKEIANNLPYLTYLYNKDNIAPKEAHISTHLKLLHNFGLVQKIPHGKRFRYALANDVFAALSKNEAEALLFAVDYFKNTAFLSVPGYFLADTLCQKFEIDPIRHQPFQFVNLDIRRILDDDVVYQSLCAMENHHDLDVVWHHKGEKKARAIRPCGILEDELGDGRRLLLTLPRKRRMRLEDIYALRKSDRRINVTIPKEKDETDAGIFFLLHFDTAEERKYLLNRVREEFPPISCDEEHTHSVRCSFHCADPKKYLPLLRSFLPYIELLPQPRTFLYRDMQSNIRQTLSVYEGQPMQEDGGTLLQKNEKYTKKSGTSSQESMFGEIYSGVYRWLSATHNKLCHETGTTTMQELLDQAPYGGKFHTNLFSRYLMMAFQFDLTTVAKDKIKENPKTQLTERDFVVVPPKKPLPILATTLELRWLKTVLHTPEADFLLDAALREKLLAALSHIKEFDLSVWKRQRNWKDVKDRPDVYESLKALVPALREQRSIVLGGIRYIPLRLCQNVSTGIYHLLCCAPHDDTLHRIEEAQFPACETNAARLSDTEIAAAYDVWHKHFPTYDEVSNNPNRPHVTIAFHNQVNARERAYTVFSAFDKESFLAQDGSYHLTVYYRDFEEEDILRRILSFGPYVTVQKPASMRDEVVRRLRKAQERYSVEAQEDQ